MAGSVVLATLSLDTVQVSGLDWFFPAITIMLVLADILTTALLCIRALVGGDRSVALLACWYLFTAVMILGNGASMPRAMVSHATMSPSPAASVVATQTTPWFWVFWHLGTAIGSLMYALMLFGRKPRAAHLDIATLSRPFALALAAGVIAVTTGVFTLAEHAGAWLPALIVNKQWLPLFKFAIGLVIAIDVAAIIAFHKHRTSEDALPTWIQLGTFLSVLEVVVMLSAAGRYSVGWYGARAMALFATLVVFAALAFELSRFVSRMRDTRSERIFRDLAEALPQMIWTSNPEGANDWYNGRWYAYTGQTHDESLGWGWKNMHHPSDLPIVMRRWPEAIATGRPFEMEYRIRGADGAYRWFLVRATPVRDSGGRIARWYSTGTDINEQRRQADALASLLAQERRVVDTLHDLLVPGIRLDVPFARFDSVYRAATDETRVGGDWYDAFALPDGRIAISIGDVTGHGLDAAASMVRAREMLRAVSTLSPTRPEAALGRVNRILCDAAQPDLVTAIFGIFDNDGSRFTYSIAGHPPPMIIRDGTVETLWQGGLPLGLADDTVFPNFSLAIAPGETLALFTDGLLEATGNVIEGEERLHRALHLHPHDADSVVEEILTATQRDDVALLMITMLAHAAPKEPERMPSGWSFSCEDAASAQSARGSFTAYLRTRGASENDIAAAEIVLGELIGNVLRHAPGSIEIMLGWEHDRPILHVLDRGKGFAPKPASSETPDLYAENGRGMFMIGAFADPPQFRARSAGGTEVIVRLPFERVTATEPEPQVSQ